MKRGELPLTEEGTKVYVFFVVSCVTCRHESGVCVCVHTSRWVSLCASRLWICLAMELNTSWRSAPSTSTSSSHWSGSTMRGSWVTCSKDSLSGLYDKINRRLGNSDTKWQIWRWTMQTAWRLGWIPSRDARVTNGWKLFLSGKCVHKSLTNACQTNDRVDSFEMSPGGRHMNGKQELNPST